MCLKLRVFFFFRHLLKSQTSRQFLQSAPLIDVIKLWMQIPTICCGSQTRSTCRWQTNGTTWITEFRHTWRIRDKKHWSYSGCSLWNNTLRSVFTSVYSLRCHSELLFTVLSEHVCADQILCNDFFFFLLCCAVAELIVRATTDIIRTLLPKGNECRSDIN